MSNRQAAWVAGALTAMAAAAIAIVIFATSAEQVPERGSMPAVAQSDTPAERTGPQGANPERFRSPDPSIAESPSAPQPEKPSLAEASGPNPDPARTESPPPNDASTTSTANQSGAGTPGSAEGSAESQQSAGADASGSKTETGPDDMAANASADAGDSRPPDDSSAPDDAGPDAVRLSGSVLRGEEPVDGARLQLTGGASSRTSYTDAEGRYFYEGVNPGVYTIVLASPPAQNNQRVLEVQPNQDQSGVDFVIPELPPVKGVVIDAESNFGIAGATLEVWRGDELLGATGSQEDGAFTLMSLDPGSFLLRGKAKGYDSEEEPFTVNAVGSSPDVRILLEPTGRIAGIVKAPSGAPLPGATVGMFGSSGFNDPYASYGTASTDGSGGFELSAPARDLPAGTFRIGVYHPQHLATYSSSYTSDSPETDAIEITMQTGGRIRGRVVDAEEEVPIEEAEVTITGGFRSTGAIYNRFGRPLPAAITDSNGDFELSGVEPGVTTVNIAALGYVPAVETVNADDRGAEDLGVIALESEDETKEGRIFGIVIDETGKGMNNHFVQVQNAADQKAYSTRTDNQGGFVFDELPEGEYSLFTNGSALRGDQFMTMDQRYPFARPGDEKIFLLYDMNQSLRLQAQTPSGQPVKNFKIGITVRNDGSRGFGGFRETIGQGMERNFQTASGEALLPNLIAGVANITVTSEQYGSEQFQGRTVPVGGVLDLGIVTLEGGAPLEGVAVSANDGAGVPNLFVKLLPPANAPSDHPLNALQFDQNTDSSGRFVFRSVTAESFDLLLEGPGWVTQRLRNRPHNLEEGTQLGEIQMQSATVFSGITLDPNGSPVPDVRIRAGDATFFSDAEGRFYTNKVPTGPLDIRFIDQRDVYAPLTLPFDLGPEGKTGVEVRFQGGAGES